MVAGRLPEKKGEIALSVKTLDKLGIEDYRIGQGISLIVGYRVVTEEKTEKRV